VQAGPAAISGKADTAGRMAAIFSFRVGFAELFEHRMAGCEFANAGEEANAARILPIVIEAHLC